MAYPSKPKNVGTVGYQAPEVCNPKPNTWYDEKIDVFSLGICMYRLFCTCPYWILPHGKVTRTTYEKVELALRNGSIPSDLADFLVDLLAWEAKDRPTSIAAKARLRLIIKQI